MLVLFCLAGFVLFVAVIYNKRLERQESTGRDIFGIKQPGVSQSSSVLFVTSHPDDECMFFAPTILHLVRKKINVHLVCLSTGNFYGEGEKRRVELLNSCLKLGVLPTQVHQLDEFPDAPNVTWDADEIATAIDRFVNSTKSKAVFTFDENGVSRHPNHIAVFRGAQKIASSVRVYTLDTVNVIRKYAQATDILPSVFNANLVVSDRRGYNASYNAMLCHKTQLVWFRRLYLLFSRYMLINTWRQAK